MEVKIEIDEELEKLVESAREFTGIAENSELFNSALKALIQREAGRRLIALGGTDPNAKYVRRRRPKF